jgi:putative sterol carrier protein
VETIELKTMEAETPKQFFEETLPVRFKPDKAKDIDVIAQLNITGPSGGEWTVKIKDQKLHIKDGTDPKATLTLNINENDFMDIINKKISAEKAFFTGRIKFKGSIAVALKMKDAGFL